MKRPRKPAYRHPEPPLVSASYETFAKMNEVSQTTVRGWDAHGLLVVFRPPVGGPRVLVGPPAERFNEYAQTNGR